MQNTFADDQMTNFITSVINNIMHDMQDKQRRDSLLRNVSKNVPNFAYQSKSQAQHDDAAENFARNELKALGKPPEMPYTFLLCCAFL